MSCLRSRLSHHQHHFAPTGQMPLHRTEPRPNRKKIWLSKLEVAKMSSFFEVTSTVIMTLMRVMCSGPNKDLGHRVRAREACTIVLISLLIFYRRPIVPISLLIFYRICILTIIKNTSQTFNIIHIKMCSNMDDPGQPSIYNCPDFKMEQSQTLLVL